MPTSELRTIVPRVQFSMTRSQGQCGNTWNLKCRQQTENALQRCVRTRLASAQLKYLVGSLDTSDLKEVKTVRRVGIVGMVGSLGMVRRWRRTLIWGTRPSVGIFPNSAAWLPSMPAHIIPKCESYTPAHCSKKQRHLIDASPPTVCDQPPAQPDAPSRGRVSLGS